MKSRTLYLLIAFTVLIGACGSETSTEEAGRSPAPPPSESAATSNVPDSTDSSSVILFLGNSLSAGAGIDSENAFPNLIRRRIDSLGWNFRVVNAGVSGETSSGGLRRIDWLLKQPVAVLVLELGGNDGLRGIPVEVAKNNLARIIDKTRDRNPDVEIVLAGMQIPPNLGHEYTRAFREMYPELAQEYDTHLIPFLLEGVGGVSALMQSDGIHPTVAGHRILAENTWETLEPVLRELRGRQTSVPQPAAP